MSYAETCPPPPNGYVFRVAAWGNHTNSTDRIRCHYYSDSEHIEIKTNEFKTKSAFASNPKWHGTDDFYFLCTSFIKDVNECAFD